MVWLKCHVGKKEIQLFYDIKYNLDNHLYVLSILWCRLLYWSDSTGIKKKVVNEVTSPVETVWNACCTQALAIDILSNNLYWFENINNNISYMKLSLTANSSQMLLNLPTDDFAPFRLTVLRNYLIVTSDTKTKFAIIDIDDSTVTFRETIRNTPYLAVAVASPIRQPSQCKLVIKEPRNLY